MAEEAIKQADELFEAKEYKKEQEVLVKLNEAEPTNIEVIWRLCRNYFSLYEDAPTKEEKVALLNKGVEVSKKGLELDPKHWGPNKWYAVLIGTLGDYLPTKEKIANSFLIKEHALKANESKPNDPSIFYMLGKWCYSVANIGFIERNAAKLLFATPPTSTYL